jgi:hypothetical protein
MRPLRFHECQRRGLLPVAAVALGAYYLLVLVPLGQKAGNLDGPLLRAEQKLALSLGQTNLRAMDFQYITSQYRETRQALAALESARKRARSQLEFGPAVRARISAPFQLVEFENERSKTLEELAKRAGQQLLLLEPGVLAGFPEFTVEVKEPELLWPALSMTDGLMETALHCKIAAIHSLAVPMAVTNAPAPGSTRLAEIPIELEFTGSASSAGKLIQSLPRRGEELRAAGYTDLPADKPPLYIDRLIVKKQSPEKPDEVRVAVRLIGFVLRE